MGYFAFKIRNLLKSDFPNATSVGSGIKDAPRRSSPASHSQAGPAASLDNPEGQFTPEPAQSPGHSACKGTESAVGKQDGSLERCEPGQAVQKAGVLGEKKGEILSQHVSERAKKSFWLCLWVWLCPLVPLSDSCASLRVPWLPPTQH